MMKANDCKSILQTIDIVVRQFKALSNTSGNKLLTNFENGLLGNREITFKAIIKVGEEEHKVEGLNFMPARDFDSGATIKSASKTYFDLYKAGMPEFSSSVIQEEVIRLIGYFAACISTGLLPSPSKRSGASTTMAFYLDKVCRKYKIKITSLVVGNMVISEKRYKSTLAIYLENAKDMFDTWTVNPSKKSKGGYILIPR